MTINWQGPEQLKTATELRKKAGKGGINRLVKDVMTLWLQGQNGGKSKP